jgi:hypothetical protein
MVPESRERELRRKELEGYEPGFASPDDALGRESGETILEAGERMVSFAPRAHGAHRRPLPDGDDP